MLPVRVHSEIEGGEGKGIPCRGPRIGSARTNIQVGGFEKRGIIEEYLHCRVKGGGVKKKSSHCKSKYIVN